jgi:protocatechuate 3,4-dioxygenase beta subunit
VGTGTEHEHGLGDDLTRRSALVRLGGLLAVLGSGTWLSSAGALAARAQTTSSGSRAASCVLTPEQTEGPYFVEGDRVRRDVREGRPGLPLLLRLGVVDADGCAPIAGAAVDIWHCDARGVYSGVGEQGTAGETFLRGIQRTNAGGVATLLTIYPGWYPGRTVHVHTMVHLGGNVVHTGQLYFSDAVTDTVYRRSPYNQRPGRNPRNSGDSIYRNGGKRSTLRIAKTGSGYVGSITMGVQRS